MRLIDAEELLKKALCTNTYFQVKSMVTDLPKIDAEPVVHAHWIEDKNFIDGAYKMRICSNCKNETMENLLPPNYCSRCGAKMDENIL